MSVSAFSGIWVSVTGMTPVIIWVPVGVASMVSLNVGTVSTGITANVNVGIGKMNRKQKCSYSCKDQ